MLSWFKKYSLTGCQAQHMHHVVHVYVCLCLPVAGQVACATLVVSERCLADLTGLLCVSKKGWW
jgi:hypothetical protein